MELTNDIKEILENVVYWETCPQDYKDKINTYLKSENETALNIDLVSNCDAIFEQDAKLTQEEIEEDCRNIPN